MDSKTFEKLSAYKDGELSSEAAEQFEQQLQQNEELRAALLTLSFVDNNVKNVFNDMLDDAVSLKQVSLINKAFDSQKSVKPDWKQNKWMLAIAASILAFVISGGAGFYAFERYNSNLLGQIQATQTANNERLSKLLQETLETVVSGAVSEYSDPQSAVSMRIVPVRKSVV